MTEPNKIDKLSVVRALLAKAERAATEEEAEAYTAKAAQLAARHGIEVALLAASGASRDDLITREITIANPYSRQKAQLLCWIGHVLGVQSVLHTPTRSRGRTVSAVTLAGHTSDVERTELLYTSLLLQAIRQLVHVTPDDTAFGTGESVTAYRRSWLLGFAARIHQRLTAVEAAARTEAQHTAPAPGSGADPSLLPAVLDARSDAVEAFYAAQFGKLPDARAPRLSGTGASDGMRAAEMADLGHRDGVAGTPRPALAAGSSS